jgi:hypothetical protein
LTTHLHVDVDDLWIYEQEYDLQRDPAASSVYDDGVFRLLELFDAAAARATFFVVARDLEHSAARDFCRTAVLHGHEIANHSFSHSAKLRSMPHAAKEREILSAHEAIAEVTGVAPVGFRAPGYYLDADMVEILAANGYLYYSSILPTFALPLMKLYIEISARKRLDKPMGRPRAAFASRRLRRLQAGAGRTIYELPVSVLPLARLPIHSTFAFQLPDRLRSAVYTSLAGAPDSVFLFHAIDGSAYPASDRLSRRVVPLRLPLERRLLLIGEALARMPASATTADVLASRNASAVPVSRLLPGH